MEKSDKNKKGSENKHRAMIVCMKACNTSTTRVLDKCVLCDERARALRALLPFVAFVRAWTFFRHPFLSTY